MDTSALAVIMVFSIPLVAILGGLGLVALKILKGGGGRSGSGGQADEVQLIQDLHRGLRKMELRIEALETILLEQERKGKD